MIQANEKAVGVLDTPATTSKSQYNASLSVSAEKPSTLPSCKELSTAKANFALLGCVLTRIHRAHDGRVTYVASRLKQARHFTHWHDVLAHLAAIGGVYDRNID